MPSTLRSGLETDYYAPDYKIEVESQELDRKSKGDILEVKVVMDIENMTSFELLINNWNDETLDFRYSDTKLFNVGNRVHVQMGYDDRLLSMMRGQITTLTPRFPESGQPTIGVTGLDGMARLRDSQPNQERAVKYVNKADWEIAQVIAERNGMRFNATQEGPRYPLVIQRNQDDAQFLMERAKLVDFECFVLTDQGSGEDTLQFIRPTDGRDSSRIRVYELEWGKSLISFNPQLTISRQVSHVTVRGWNPATKSSISFRAGPEHLEPRSGDNNQGTSGPESVQRSMPNRQEVVIDAPVTTEEEAQVRAIRLLRERAYEFITGSGQVIGLPDLRPGDNLKLLKLGDRFSGNYYVKKVEHTLDSKGFLTSFDVRRTFDGGVR